MGLAIFEKNSFFSFFRAPYNFFWTQKLNLASKTSLLGGHLLTSKQWFLRFPGLRLPKQVIFNSETINWIKEFKKYDPPQKWGFWCQIRFWSPKIIKGGTKKWKKLFFSKRANLIFYLKSYMASVDLMGTSCTGICLEHQLSIFWLMRRGLRLSPFLAILVLSPHPH